MGKRRVKAKRLPDEALHPFVLVQHPARALIRQVARRQAGDGHGPLNQFLGRGADAQLEPLALDFATRFTTM